MSDQLIVCKKCLGLPRTETEKDFDGLHCWCMFPKVEELTLETLWSAVKLLIDSKADHMEND